MTWRDLDKQELFENITVSQSEDKYWKPPFSFITTQIKPVSDVTRVPGWIHSLCGILIATYLRIWYLCAHHVIKWCTAAFCWCWQWQHVSPLPSTAFGASYTLLLILLSSPAAWGLILFGEGGHWCSRASVICPSSPSYWVNGLHFA